MQPGEREKLQAAYDHLMNLQPHIGQLPTQYRGFIDLHVNEAMIRGRQMTWRYTKFCGCPRCAA